MPFVPLIVTAQMLPSGSCEYWNWLRPDKPDVIYLALVAATSAILSAWLVNRHARKLQKASLAHDVQQKEAERLNALRREVYLPLADSMVLARDSLVKVVDLQAASADYSDPITKFNQLLSKATLIASP